MSHSQRPRNAEESGELEALEARDLSLGEVLGKYRLLGALGHGGMADVYLAVADGPEGFRKLCVIKLLKESMAQDEEFRAMFLDEARLAARLNHPNVVQTFEVGDLGGRLMLAMEYVEGQPATRVRRRLSGDQLPLTVWIRVLCDVLEALEYAHTLTDFDGSLLGIVHRDVSPHNILLGYDGRVKLVDFGIAKSSAAEQLTQAGVLKGKVGYMAPEQASLGEVDGRADLFSVGVILWEVIANRRLVEGLSSSDVIVRRAAGEDPKIADVVPGVDPELAAICDRAMARHPADRFASAADFQTELERWLQKQGEPNRKEWARTLRDAFAQEREQLRALVEQRVSSMQQAGYAASFSKLLATPDSLTPPKTPPPSSSTQHLGGIASRTIPPDGPNAETLLAPSTTPPSHTAVSAGGRRSSLALILGIAASVVVGASGIAYVVSSQTTANVAPPAQHVEPSSPPDEAAAATAHPSSTASPSSVASSSSTASGAMPVAALPSASTSVSTTSATHPPRPATPPRPPPVGPRHGTATAAAPSAPPPASTPAAPSPPAPTKTPSRPLDEKDPYAP